MIKAIVFDFDGTIANTLPLIFIGIQSVFREFAQMTLSDSDVIARFGPTEEGIIYSGVARSDFERAVGRFFEIYETEHERVVAQNDAIHELLAGLKQKGLRLGLFTGKGRRAAEISLRKLNLAKYFNVILTGDDVTAPKPHPEGIFLALSLLNVKPHETAYVGDSAADMQAAKRAGVLSIGVHWLETSQNIGDTPCDARVETVQEFFRLPFIS